MTVSWHSEITDQGEKGKYYPFIKASSGSPQDLLGGTKIKKNALLADFF